MVREVEFAPVVKYRQAVLPNCEAGDALQYFRCMPGGVRVFPKLGMAGGKEGVMQAVRYGNVPKGLNGIRIAFCHKLRTRKVEPEALRVVRVETHGFADPFDSLFRLAKPE